MSLVIDYTELQKSVGHYLGYGRNVHGSDDESEAWADIEECIKSGLRQFYTPPMVSGQQQLYNWSFLKPVATLSLVSGTQDYDMPNDFAGIIGNMTYEPCEAYYPIVVVGETQIRKLRQVRGDEVGDPKFVAIRPQKTTGSAIQGFEAIFWAKPNAAADISYRYYVAPAMLTNELKYPYGGAFHSETILQSCLSIAEQRLNDNKGVQWDKFMERLAASIQHDMSIKCPDFFGYNGDNSDNNSVRVDRTDEVTYNGNSID